PGSVCYLLQRNGLRAMFTGDVITSLGDPEAAVGSTGAPAVPLGAYPAYLPPRYRGNARDYLCSLRKLRALPAPDLVFPGHPRNDDGPQNPRVAPERWRSIVDQGIGHMKNLVGEYEVAARNV